jgi:hypothetical protein
VADSNIAERVGASPKKLALIGVLAAVLGGVLYVRVLPLLQGEQEQVAGVEESVEIPQPTKAQTKAAAPAKSVLPVGESQEWLLEPINRPQWKVPELAQVVRYDPFALPAAFPQPAGAAGSAVISPDGVVMAAETAMDEESRTLAVTEIQAKLAELKQRGVRVIIDGRRAAAMVGDRTIHVGDEIEGFTVKAIEADGVVVERKLE